MPTGCVKIPLSAHKVFTLCVGAHVYHDKHVILHAGVLGWCQNCYVFEKHVLHG